MMARRAAALFSPCGASMATENQKPLRGIQYRRSYP